MPFVSVVTFQVAMCRRAEKAQSFEFMSERRARPFSVLNMACENHEAHFHLVEKSRIKVPKVLFRRP